MNQTLNSSSPEIENEEDIMNFSDTLFMEEREESVSNNKRVTKELTINETLKLEEQQLQRELKRQNNEQKYVFKKRGLYLMIGCGTVYAIIVITDTILSNAFNWEMSSLTNGFVELLKFIISTLIGFVFSESKKENE